MTVGAQVRSIMAPRRETSPVQARRVPQVLDARVLLAASLVLSALSLFVSRSPVYDVWTWLVWGREMAHGDLVTSFGPQFKPLPIFVAALATPFGSAEVPIWMFIAHAAGFLGVGAAARLAWRAAGPVAAAISALSLLSCYQFTFYLLPYGMSEPMLIALAFWAIDRHCDGRRSAALILLCGAALLRPEVWPFLLAYAVVLFRRRQVRRALLLSLLLLVPAAWFLPEWWGSGNPFRTGGGRAVPGGPTSQDHPGLAVLQSTFDQLLTWVWVGALTGVAIAVWTRERLLLVFTAIAIAWLALIAALTEVGTSSGVIRYLIVTQAMICVLAGVGWVKLARFLRDLLRSWPIVGRLVPPVLLAALAVPSVLTLQGLIDKGMKDIQWQQGAYLATGQAVKRAGGAPALRTCGAFIWSVRYMEPEFAWLLHKHLYYARSEFEPDMPANPSMGPLVRLSLKGRTRLIGVRFSLTDYHEVARATSHGVIAVVLSPC